MCNKVHSYSNWQSGALCNCDAISMSGVDVDVANVDGTHDCNNNKRCI